jgi:glutathione synthase/RimK-type ligase-like ATP-grasp enzyme
MENKKLLRRNKWEKWVFMNSIEDLKQYQPFTRLYSKNEVEEFISLFESAFIKPSGSLGGINVIKIYRNTDIITAVHDCQEYNFSSIDEFDKWLKPIRKNKLFLIQQSIDLATFEEKPADIRIIAQLNENKTWEITGWYAKVAKSGSVVTNTHSGGSMITIENYLKHLGYDKNERTDIIQQMFDLSIKICESYSNAYRNVKYGLDIGFDKNGKIWLIEINTQPWISLLKRIDRRMYARTVYISRLNKNSKI